MSEWIDVKNKLPENHSTVLVVNKDGEIAVCKFDKTEWKYFFMLYDTSLQIINVTHWMPTPELPKKEESNNE